ncbi:type 1 glutamine amidotransferase [Engelhardtia mirabilis]|uniref:GMP synthase [glutamine-hydrolyzing] n=1 Tax=Engelhardtia mirabilis TaxID=2528011 RepID=A0A518BDC0_9BACT|nr:GMP synthase [glutamine-hydrolyzing] [Planctomycetes bacterium Pla133]QDU99291.1 GMP synthase [glutamine-hydrolyzing] [Planctomycetes bacterium Pla86]
MKPILVLDAYLDDLGGARNLEPRLGGRAAEVARVARTGTAPIDATSYAGILITGSSASLLEPPVWVQSAAELMRSAAANDVPVLGLCFGHQLLAHALLGPDRVVLAEVPELGFVEIERRGGALDPILEGFDRRFTAFESHRDEVRPRGDEVEILAANAACAVQAFRIPGQPLWGVQFHPEMGQDEIRALIRQRAAQDTSGRFDADGLLAAAVDTDALGDRIVANFLEQVDARASANR